MLAVHRAVSDHWNRWRLRRLTRPGFAIISNNCWGAGIYRDLDLPYNTPFVGTLLAPECYLKLLADIPGYLAQPLRFLEQSRYPWKIRYPIGALGDIEVHFKHYADRAEALDKWSRRVERFPLDPATWRVKFCDHHVPSDPAEAAPVLTAFDRTPFRHKICLLGRRQPALTCGVVLRECLRAGRAPDGHAAYRVSMRYLDLPRWLNGQCPSTLAAGSLA